MIRTLHIFCDLVKTQSFTKAAEQNYITQSAVSHHIKTLEDKFGHRLLIRGHGSIKLTNAGQKLYNGSLDILTRYEQLERSLKKADNEISGSLKIATTIALGLHELPKHLTTFLKKYPKVDIKLTYLKAPEIYGCILGFEAELGLLAYPVQTPSLEIKTFKEDKLVLIAGPKHPWTHLRQIEIRRLFAESFIALEQGLPTRKAIDRILNRYDVNPNITHTFDNIESIKQAVKVGLGISIVPEGTIREEILLKTLNKIEIKEGPFECPLAILTRKNTEPSPAAKTFIRMLLP